MLWLVSLRSHFWSTRSSSNDARTIHDQRTYTRCQFWDVKFGHWINKPMVSYFHCPLCHTHINWITAQQSITIYMYIQSSTTTNMYPLFLQSRWQSPGKLCEIKKSAIPFYEGCTCIYMIMAHPNIFMRSSIGMYASTWLRVVFCIRSINFVMHRYCAGYR